MAFVAVDEIMVAGTHVAAETTVALVETSQAQVAVPVGISQVSAPASPRLPISARTTAGFCAPGLRRHMLLCRPMQLVNELL